MGICAIFNVVIDDNVLFFSKNCLQQSRFCYTMVKTVCC